MPISVIYSISLLVLSWFVIYVFEKKDLFKTWLKPGGQRSKEFGLGFIFMAVLRILTNLMLAWIGSFDWMLSENATIQILLNSLFYDINSVLIEELVYRGVLLYLLIKYLGSQKGTVISGIAFGIHHWFSYGVLGNFLGMSLVFLTTGFMGYAFARAYAKSNSIILPFGLHLGWNMIHNSIFSQGSFGTVVFTQTQPVELAGIFALISFFLYLLVPAAVIYFIKTNFYEYVTKS